MDAQFPLANNIAVVSLRPHCRVRFVQTSLKRNAAMALSRPVLSSTLLVLLLAYVQYTSTAAGEKPTEPGELPIFLFAYGAFLCVSRWWSGFSSTLAGR